MWLGAAGQATERDQLGTSVLTPTLRYHPSIIAQAFGTLGVLSPGRVFLGVGTGESLNETPATGAAWPSGKERRLRLTEAIELIRRLWTEERVDFDGEYYQTQHATIYDRPDQPVPIYVAASGPLAAKLAGTRRRRLHLHQRQGARAVRAAHRRRRGGRSRGRPRPGAVRHMIEIKVSYDTDAETALRNCDWWAALALTPDEKTGVEDPIEMERLADAAIDRAHTRFIVSTDPDEVVEKIAPYVDARLHASWCSTRRAPTRRASSSCSAATCCRACARASADQRAASPGRCSFAGLTRPESSYGGAGVGSSGAAPKLRARCASGGRPYSVVRCTG